MRLSCLLANFTRNESDALRKALCRKQIAVLASFKDQFLNGGRLNGYSTDSLDRIWNDWVNIASYAFNKSHAVCYTWLAYQTAYLKAHYPEEFRKTTLRFNQNCAKFENL